MQKQKGQMEEIATSSELKFNIYLILSSKCQIQHKTKFSSNYDL